MQIPMQVTFRNMDRSEEIENLVRDKAAKLDEFSDQIVRCRVVVEPKGKRHEHGNLYDVRIDLTVPGEELAVTRAPSEHTEYRDLHAALRDSFDAAVRLLEDHMRRKRRAVKTLETAPHAKVAKLVPQEGYGFLQTLDGREVYFHKNSVVQEGFDRLEVGTEVAFVEQAGAKGPQASTVRAVGRHGHV